MKAKMLKATGFSLLVALGVGIGLGTVGTAHASHMNVSVVEPTPALVGQASELDATVTSADVGLPAAGVPVTFYAHATSGKVSGYMEIGRGVTDANGVAKISFIPREAGAHDIRVDYVPTSGGAVEQTKTSIAVDGAPSQLYVQTAGIQVPGLGSWLIIVVLSTVWAILFGVSLTVIRIASRSGGSQAAALVEEATGRRGSALGAGTAI